MVRRRRASQQRELAAALGDQVSRTCCTMRKAPTTTAMPAKMSRKVVGTRVVLAALGGRLVRRLVPGATSTRGGGLRHPVAQRRLRDAGLAVTHDVV